MSDKELKLECLKLAYINPIPGKTYLETAIIYFSFLVTVGVNP